MANKPWNAVTFSADEIAMSRCKSPVGSSGSNRIVRHERGGSADTGLIKADNLSSYASSEEPNQFGNNEEDSDIFYNSYGTYNGGELTDDADGSKTKAAMDHVRLKIGRTKDLIRSEQTARDDNVNEYLKLASNADKQQLARIKSIFEKKNQKSAVNISQLQKKLEAYNKRLKDLETHGLTTSHHLKQPKEMLRDVGHGLRHVGGNIRDGISGLSGSVMSKPREFAHLIRNKFGSADNINSISRSSEAELTEDNSDQSSRNHHGSATLPGGIGLHTSTNNGAVVSRSEDGASECSSVTSESIPPRTSQAPPPPASASPSLEPVWAELDHLRSKIEHIKQLVSKDIASLNHSLQEERFRTERLEEQINDLTELHQNEVENLKQTITDMEEKVQYQSEERLRDIHEMLESCQTKMSKMEHQQAQHQQYVTLEGLDNSNARALVVKLINVLLTVLQVVLLLVATFAGILMPFLRTRLRILTTTVVVAGLFIALKQWPDSVSLSDYLINHGKQAFLSLK
ncbi:transmembrane and coiled-coil domains protein 2 isoform X2 [Daktulosphaira vitifoliae]|uniref:transmembrane and coiled-coil domains protein 2 isoform X2 n=1 Tax=Daktulosphaira vitifoliae TaxID=58002 RepID=UPI0021AAB361|nr:transmembrane and coiled-coil domains protein 2 isoform X2 [Daktulosphaira vitifoliae]